MSTLQSLLFGTVSFLASIVGAICGIGGGVIIKPTLDLFGWAGVSTISFLSGCTVLSMSCYSLGKSMLAGEKSVDLKTGTPLPSAQLPAVRWASRRSVSSRVCRQIPAPSEVYRQYAWWSSRSAH